MKIKQLLFYFLFSLVGLCCMQVNGQSISMEIKKNNNSEQQINLNDLRKITFSGTDMVLNYNSGSSENVLLDDISIIKFGIISAVISPSQNENQFAVYPNPATDYICLKVPITKNIDVKIFTVNGIEVLNETLTSDNQVIRVGNLAKGLYFVYVNNQVSKFTKQ